MERLHEAQDMGIVVKKKWLAAHDDRVRDAHAELDGQEVGIDEPFHSSLGDIMYPGNPTADPALVYNCRCTLTYVYDVKKSVKALNDAEQSDIIMHDKSGESSTEALSGKEIMPVGTIDRKIFASISERITTSDVIITSERIEHCNKHDHAFDKYGKYAKIVLSDPDYIFEDQRPNTAILIKQIIDEGKIIELILRLHVQGDAAGRKNSILSYWDIGDKTLKRYLRNKKGIYKKG